MSHKPPKDKIIAISNRQRIVANQEILTCGGAGCGVEIGEGTEEAVFIHEGDLYCKACYQNFHSNLNLGEVKCVDLQENL